jgi:hypothetical protein
MSFQNEKTLSLSQLARRVGANTATLWRWAAHGADGVLLESFVQNGRRCSTVEAFRRFVAERNALLSGVCTECGRHSKHRIAEFSRRGGLPCNVCGAAIIRFNHV